jgi:hypothetical protein
VVEETPQLKEKSIALRESRRQRYRLGLAIDALAKKATDTKNSVVVAGTAVVLIGACAAALSVTFLLFSAFRRLTRPRPIRLLSTRR